MMGFIIFLWNTDNFLRIYSPRNIFNLYNLCNIRKEKICSIYVELPILTKNIKKNDFLCFNFDIYITI